MNHMLDKSEQGGPPILFLEELAGETSGASE